MEIGGCAKHSGKVALQNEQLFQGFSLGDVFKDIQPSMVLISNIPDLGRKSPDDAAIHIGYLVLNNYPVFFILQRLTGFSKGWYIFQNSQTIRDDVVIFEFMVPDLFLKMVNSPNFTELMVDVKNVIGSVVDYQECQRRRFSHLLQECLVPE